MDAGKTLAQNNYCLVAKLAVWKTLEAEYLLSLLHFNQPKGGVFVFISHFSDDHSKVRGYCEYGQYFSPSILARKDLGALGV